MEDVAKPSGLQRRKQGYYIRVRVPQDLEGVLGKKEIIRSLKTQDYKIACRKVPEERVLINRLFDDQRYQLTEQNNNKIHLSSLSRTQMLAMAIEWIRQYEEKEERVLAQKIWNELEWEDVRDIYREDDGQVFQAIKENQWQICSGTVEKSLKERNISYEKNSPEFIRLARLFLEALGEVTTKALLRHEGKPVPSVIDSKFLVSYTPYLAPDTKAMLTLEELAAEFNKRNISGVSTRRYEEYQFTFEMMFEFLGKETLIDKISRQQFRLLADKIKNLPVNLRKKFPASQYSFLEAYENASKQGLKIISICTYNNYIQKVGTIVNYAMQENYISVNLAQGLSEEDKTAAKHKRYSFSTEQLQQIFSAPLYTGCKDAGNGHNKAGELIPKDSYRFWLPLIALWTGMRSSEICQLECSDVGKEENIDVIYIRETISEVDGNKDDGAFKKRVKNKNATRYVPIHPELKRIGFLEFVERARSRGKRLFPDVTVYKGLMSHQVSRWFNETFLPKYIQKTSKTVFHSFRHTYRDGMRNGEIPIEAVCLLGGWSFGDAVHNAYGGGYDIEKLYEYMCRLSYKNIDFSHLYEA